MKHRLKLIFAAWLVALLPVFPAFALELEAAKAQGLVGETPTGYIGAVSNSTPEVQELMARVNAERRTRYQAIAAENRTPVAAVEALAGQKAVEKTPPGQYVRSAQGGWVKK